MLFDGKPEAVGNVDASAANFKAELAKERERLVVPAAPELDAQLARRYSSPALGDVTVVNDAGTTTFDFGEWKSKMASRKNDDGTFSFITTDPTNMGFEFVVADRSGKRAAARARRLILAILSDARRRRARAKWICPVEMA